MSAPERCFFCQYNSGHGRLCPVGYPSNHYNKRVWWAGHHQGIAGKALDASAYKDADDVSRFTMGWTVGAEAIAPVWQGAK